LSVGLLNAPEAAHSPTMEAIAGSASLSVEEYLAGEPRSEVRHEYLGGIVYAMAGASVSHNLISGNLFAALRTHLRGSPCGVFIADVKVRLHLANDDIFYYPDVMVACDARDNDEFFKRYPKVLIEVMSESTERIDRREKRWSYQQIETLEEYVLVAQDRMEVTLYRRANQWRPELLTQADQQLQLPSLDFVLPLNAIYEGVKV
jgi:Uma2 family endonuclease